MPSRQPRRLSAQEEAQIIALRREARQGPQVIAVMRGRPPSTVGGPTRHAYPTSNHRARALAGYLRWYNNHQPHGSLQARPPISRVSHVCEHSI